MMDLIANRPAFTRARGRDERLERPAPGRWLVGLTVAALLLAAAVVAVTAWSAVHRMPGDRSAEAGFARDMSIHHQQAVQMAMLIIDRTDDPAIRLLAQDIALTQQNQVGQMRGWLDLWKLSPTGSEPAMQWMGHASDGPLPGMATSEEIDQLGKLSGVAADKTFLQLMVRHHEGGAPMAQAALERSDEPVVRRLARSIVQSQTAEVTLMKEMLSERGS